jgi:antitoxin ParD1/3/4
MSKNTSILLGSHFDNFIQEEIVSGKYSSVSEVVRTALRLLEEEELKKRHLVKELELGEKSSIDQNFNPKLHLKKLKNSIK